MSRKGAIRVMALLCASFPRDLKDETVEIYVASLSDLPDEAMTQVVSQMILSSRWLPTIAEIREATVREIDPSALAPTPEQAWNEILEASERLGRYQSPTWSHEAIGHALAQSGGYGAVCSSHAIEPIRRRFQAVYAPIAQTIHKSALSRRLDASHPTQAIDRAHEAIPSQTIRETDQPGLEETET